MRGWRPTATAASTGGSNDWNASNREFYEAHGASALTEWIPYRVSGDALSRLAAAGLDPHDLADIGAM